MGTYDFYGQLEPMEFQRFARDIIQAREGIHLESFAETGDGFQMNPLPGILCRDRRRGHRRQMAQGKGRDRHHISGEADPEPSAGCRQE